MFGYCFSKDGSSCCFQYVSVAAGIVWYRLTVTLPPADDDPPPQASRSAAALDALNPRAVARFKNSRRLMIIIKPLLSKDREDGAAKRPQMRCTDDETAEMLHRRMHLLHMFNNET